MYFSMLILGWMTLRLKKSMAGRENRTWIFCVVITDVQQLHQNNPRISLSIFYSDFIDTNGDSNNRESVAPSEDVNSNPMASFDFFYPKMFFDPILTCSYL